MKKLIMTDLDGTLLPLDQDNFINAYFASIIKLFDEKGYNGKRVAKAVQASSYYMFKNNGERTNEEVFLEKFSEYSMMDNSVAMTIFDELYEQRFDEVKGEFAKRNPYIDTIVRLMKEKGEYTVVATQPVFPISACAKRLNWAGTDKSEFDLVTTYDVSSHCKPNPDYYKAIMQKFSATSDNTLMIGNDVVEDILPCKQLNIDTFLLTECLIDHSKDISDINHGGYEKLIEYLKTI